MKQAVIAIVKSKNANSIVLIKRRDVPVWVLPGGGIDSDESPENAVVREALEETGLHVQIVRKVGIYTPINKLTNITHVFECEQIQGHKQITEETRDIHDFDINNLPSSFFIIHHDWLKDAQLNLPHPVTKALTQVTYWGLAKYFLRHPLWVLRAILARLGIPLNTN